jgi:hypothetical protein
MYMEVHGGRLVDWLMGSCLFFWRWPKCHRKDARDGYWPYIQNTLLAYKRPELFEKDLEVHSKVREKLAMVWKKRYIVKREVKSLTSYFSLPKGDQDIRMVYDATKSTLNKCLQAPNFGLPTVGSLVKGIDESVWMEDLDIGEMFLNFCLYPELQPYCGVDVKPYFSDEGKPWEVGEVFDGIKTSPYHTAGKI